MKKVLIIFIVLLTSTAAYSQNSIKYTTYNNKIVSLPIEDGKITFTKTGIIKIFPENIEYVTHINFMMITNIQDYSFLTEFINLERLDFFTTRINNYSFLKLLPELKSLWIEGEDFLFKKLDLTSNKKLKHLSLTNSNIMDIDNIIGLNNDIELIILWYNKMNKLPELFEEKYPKSDIIFIEKNITNKIKNSRIIYEIDSIPDRYFTFLP